MRVCLIVYDNDSYIHWFPQGLAYIARAMKDAGHEVVIYNQDAYHYPESHLTEYLSKNRFDAVGVSIVAGYYQYRKLLLLAEAINKVPNRPYFIMGGHGPAPDPEYFLKKTGADFIAIGEGERTAVELLSALEHKSDLSKVDGIACMSGGKLIKTKPRELIQDIDTIPLPAWELFPIDYYSLVREGNLMRNNQRALQVVSGRGCTFQCNFCYRLDVGFRPRSAESIIEEIQILKKDYHVSYIIFSDELLMTSVERTVNLCEAFIKAKLDINWLCNGRLNYAFPEVLKVMKLAGCNFINYGIESFDNGMLKVMNKGLTTDRIIKGVEATLAEGMSPGLNIIFGNIGETEEILQKGVDFIMKYDNHAQMRTIRPVTPYPGSPLYDYAIEKGLIKDCADFYENKHKNSDLLSANFTNMTDDEFHMALFRANKQLIENYYKHAQERSLEAARKLYVEKDATFRGFRQS